MSSWISVVVIAISDDAAFSYISVLANMAVILTQILKATCKIRNKSYL